MTYGDEDYAPCGYALWRMLREAELEVRMALLASLTPFRKARVLAEMARFMPDTPPRQSFRAVASDAVLDDPDALPDVRAIYAVVFGDESGAWDDVFHSFLARYASEGISSAGRRAQDRVD